MIDIGTGEVLDMKAFSRMEKCKGKRYLEALDISQMTSRRDFVKRKRDIYERGCPQHSWVDFHRIVTEEHQGNVKLMAQIGKGVVYHNYCVVDISQLRERFGWGKRMVQRKLRELREEGWIKILQNVEEGRLIQVHPYFDFIGSDRMREECFKLWYKTM